MEEKYFRIGKEVHPVCWTRIDEHRGEARLHEACLDEACLDQGKKQEVAGYPLGDHRFLLVLPTGQFPVDYVRDGETLHLQIDGQSFQLKEEETALAAGETGAEEGERELRAPMPGKVVKILVKPGQEIKKAASLIILDSMKVEIELKASRDGVVDQVLVKEGEQLKMDQELITFKS